MIEKTLRVTDPDSGDLVLALTWRDGRVAELWNDPDIQESVREWTERGLTTWTSDADGWAEPTHVTIADEQFVPRLAAHLRGRYGFVADERNDRPSKDEPARSSDPIGKS